MNEAIGKLGFGVPASGDESLISELARKAEQLGYAQFWVNDTPAADGLLAARWAADATETINIGIGVLPLDRRDPVSIANDLQRHALPIERTIVGVGAGFSPHPRRTVADGVQEIRKLLGPDIILATAAMGDRMMALGAAIADMVLLNWVTADWLTYSTTVIRGGEAAGRAPAKMAAYVRVGAGPAGAAAVREEAERYAMLPHYAKHFSAMNVEPGEVGISGSPDEIASALMPFRKRLDVTVVRAVGPEDLKALLEVAEAAAPVK